MFRFMTKGLLFWRRKINDTFGWAKRIHNFIRGLATEWRNTAPRNSLPVFVFIAPHCTLADPSKCGPYGRSRGACG